MFKNPEMLRRFKDIVSFPKDKQEHILFAIDPAAGELKGAGLASSVLFVSSVVYLF